MQMQMHQAVPIRCVEVLGTKVRMMMISRLRGAS